MHDPLDEFYGMGALGDEDEAYVPDNVPVYDMVEDGEDHLQVNVPVFNMTADDENEEYVDNDVLSDVSSGILAADIAIGSDPGDPEVGVGHSPPEPSVPRPHEERGADSHGFAPRYGPARAPPPLPRRDPKPQLLYDASRRFEDSCFNHYYDLLRECDGSGDRFLQKGHRLLTKRDPEYYSEGMIAARLKEWDTFEKFKTLGNETGTLKNFKSFLVTCFIYR